MEITGRLEMIVKKGIVSLSLMGIAALSACGYLGQQLPETVLPSLINPATFTPTPFRPEVEYTSTPTVTPSPTPSPTGTLEPTQYLTLTEVCDDEKKIVVDISEQMIYAVLDDLCTGERVFANASLVSTGVAAHPTVLGEYSVYTKLESTDMAGPGYYLKDVPYTMYFFEGYGIHGTYWHNNFGTPMSHGCVNLPTDMAEWFFNWADIGTRVIVQP